MFESLEHAREKAREYLPEEYIEQVLQLLTPALGIKPTVTDQPKHGASRLGGSPDLPADVTWPATTSSQNAGDPEFELLVVTDSVKEELAKNTPFAFVGQVNLAELHAASDLVSELPKTGMLYFSTNPY